LVSGVGERTDRPPVRARSGRRPLPPIIFLLVLAIAALAVWWNVFRTESEQEAHQQAACSTAQAAAPSMDPTTVHLRVRNATDQKGLANQAADALRQFGFVVDQVDNDDSGREVKGTGEVRYGPRGADTARFVGLYVPKATTYQDTRATAVVDVVLGPDFALPDSVATAEDAAAALAAGESAQSAC
jgi:LytR cell envelope-related transcriptional attenuator